MGTSKNDSTTPSYESLLKSFNLIKEFKSTDELVNIEKSMSTLFMQFIRTQYFADLKSEHRDDIVYHCEAMQRFLKGIAEV
ncbi:hypothetical protein [Myroides odoratus]|uniref:Uncharacterized protein n=1 Tax=Myroides odoratus TaxID=256 RepID=A0A9Q7E727_MYROD|nr:hypothetical protein [Myroides odoratus]EHQ41529.1 hypothetical protein Myrod_0693 [Myroides odoratus DSM 2801]EKB02678.1 hypothetical protein HMPREF9716_03707 [Myroides odoratus CIP 103059]QQT98950.1 hypothetical protein I6I88_12080 [Myroides odoratus]WQD58863.1 hypothetical protein U0010_06895 [Myroides odoratus]STZ28792.1 Uncharacterised protein [Myroides odoratus]